jgi:Ca2+-binding RTX toxin-like protein
VANLATGTVTGSGTDTLLSIENLTGSNYNDILIGSGAANALSGGSGADSLTGGAGADKLTGGLGADRFIFTTLSDSGIAATTRDTIADFNSVQLDKIDLSAIDANTVTTGDQAFSFIGSAAFTAAGQLRYDAVTHLLYGDVNGDNVADFSIGLTGVASVVAGDFIL